MPKRLIDTVVTSMLRKAVSSGLRLSVRDSVVKGLTLRAFPSGGAWALQYRVKGDRRQILGTLGPVSEISLADARKLARTWRRIARKGRDPRTAFSAKRTDGTPATFGDLCERFLSARKANIAESTAYEYERYIKTEISPDVVASVRPDDLRRHHVREILAKVAERAPVQANRLFQFIRAVVRWGVREDYLDRNPIDGLQLPSKQVSSERVLSDDEVRCLWQACGNFPAGVAVKTLLLLGQRSTETLEMRWSDVDLDAKLWSIPGKYRKGGRAHAVPLPDLAVTILKVLPRDNDRVFHGVDVSNQIRWFGPLRNRAREIAEADDVKMKDFVKHDLRRTCATGCARLGASETTVSRLLGHAVIAGTVPVSAIYDRYTRLDDVRRALARWAAFVEKIVIGNRGADVVAFQR